MQSNFCRAAIRREHNETRVSKWPGRTPCLINSVLLRPTKCLKYFLLAKTLVAQKNECPGFTTPIDPAFFQPWATCFEESAALFVFMHNGRGLPAAACRLRSRRLLSKLGGARTAGVREASEWRPLQQITLSLRGAVILRFNEWRQLQEPKGTSLFPTRHYRRAYQRVRNWRRTPSVELVF